MVVSELSCSYHQHVASDAQLAPDQQLLSQASGKHGCFVSDGQCIQHLQPSTPDACAVLLHDASQAETQTPGSAPSGTAKSEPFQLLAANASPSNASCKLAAAAGHVLHIFNLGSQPYQQGFNADAAPTLSQQLQEATGARWRALAWHPVQHDILAAASQEAVYVCRSGGTSSGAQLKVLACMQPSKPCRSPVVRAAWVAGTALQGAAAHSSCLVVAWGSELVAFTWEQPLAQGSEATRHALPLSISSPPRALAAGPNGSLLFTFDVSLSLGASSMLRHSHSKAVNNDPTAACAEQTSRTAAPSNAGNSAAAAPGSDVQPQVALPEAIDLRGKLGTGGSVPAALLLPHLQPASTRLLTDLSPAVMVADSSQTQMAAPQQQAGCDTSTAAEPAPQVLDLCGRIGQGAGAGSLLTSLLGGSLLNSEANTTHQTSEVNPSSTQPAPAASMTAVPVPRLLQHGLSNESAASRVPSSFLLDHQATGAGGSTGNAGGSSSLCLLFPRQLIQRRASSSAQTLTLDTGACSSDFAAQAPVLLPRPDMLSCMGDMVAVGSSCGRPLVQLFQVVMSSISTSGSSAHGINSYGSNHADISGFSNGAIGEKPAPGETHTLQALRCFALNGPVLAPSTPGSTQLLRGLALCLEPPAGAGPASSQGQGLQLVTLQGAVQEDKQGAVAPSFLSINKAGLKPTRLAPLLCCTFDLPGVSISAPQSKDPAPAAVAGASSGELSAVLAFISSRFEELERRMEQRLGRLEAKVDALTQLVTQQGHHQR